MLLKISGVVDGGTVDVTEIGRCREKNEERVRSMKQTD